MSVVSEVFEYEEIIEIADEIKQILIGRPDLLNIFNNLVKNYDMNYQTESSASSEEYSDSEVVDEKITLKQEENGHIWN